MCIKNVKCALQKSAIITLILIFSLLCGIFTSCKEKQIEYDETEVLKEAQRLLKSAEIVNSIFYGEGIHNLGPVLVQLMPDKIKLPSPFIDIGNLPCIRTGSFQDSEQLFQVFF
jgi:hypothetical protein